ncbi:unnamed protein product [marine sediment metagenome]|uniref:Uncharacterized protein n=1 Tax=marine sediment metagenome TaxID=412755 RepID=X1LA95_9ZZZZ
MSLRQLAIRVLEASGLVRQSNLRVLRDRLKREPEEKLLREVEDCETPRQLRVLWEAGLSSRLQEAVTKRLEQIS